MPTPSAEARTRLDKIRSALAAAAREKRLYLTLENFHPERIVQAALAERRIRKSLFTWSGGLLLVIFAVLAFAGFTGSGQQSSNAGTVSPATLYAAIWFFALGGLGAVVNLFSVYLRLLPTEALRENDAFEVNGRILLGGLFSIVLSLTVLAGSVTTFFEQLLVTGTPKGGISLLIPFGVGYAIPFALALIQRFIGALHFIFNMEEGSGRGPRSASGPTQRR